MSSEKRRRARVQGGWAAPSNKPRSDRDKPQVPAAPAWLTKNADTTSVPKFVYEEPEVLTHLNLTWILLGS